MNKEKIKIGFFGTPEHAVKTLEKLRGAGFDIAFVVTQPDRPQGRKLVLTPPPAKVWAEENKVPVFQPEKLKDLEFQKKLVGYGCDVFVVIAYGKIIPESVLDIPKYKSLNIHGSLLPKYRGSCPIESAILSDDRKTGVTIIRMDKEMDHGPIVAKEEVIFEPWPPTTDGLREKIVEAGTNLLISILPNWVKGKIEEKEQDHSHATYTKMIEKEDGLIDLSDDPHKNYLKIQAYHGWPSAFFFAERDGKKIRVKITEASYHDGKLEIQKVIPEGKKETGYRDWSPDSIAK
ncbi:MAG: methionyl-tRNA formyltransferase [Patescibacteria group bacterium]|mgnify:CR=1 FL=1